MGRTAYTCVSEVPISLVSPPSQPLAPVGGRAEAPALTVGRASFPQVDSKEYYAPVITPFEAELAFCNKEWPGHLRLDFQSLIEGDTDSSPSAAATEPRFSLLTGRLTGQGGDGGDADAGALNPWVFESRHLESRAKGEARIGSRSVCRVGER
jgi:hypothetical protein